MWYVVQSPITGNLKIICAFQRPGKTVAESEDYGQACLEKMRLEIKRKEEERKNG